MKINYINVFLILIIFHKVNYNNILCLKIIIFHKVNYINILCLKIIILNTNYINILFSIIIILNINYNIILFFNNNNYEYILSYFLKI